MRVILSGYEKSKVILTASAYLTAKHLKGFQIYYLNYGDFYGDLFGARYVSLKEKQENGSQDWSKDIARYLDTLTDEKIIFALDDYLLDGFDAELYKTIDPQALSVNLCAESVNNPDMYHVTTQYTLWNRDLLIEILREVKTPWEFEINGSQYFNKLNIPFVCVPCLRYPSNSALSGRWKGVRTYGREIMYL